MPFLQLQRSQTAGSHLSRPIGGIFKDGSDFEGELLFWVIAVAAINASFFEVGNLFENHRSGTAQFRQASEQQS